MTLQERVRLVIREKMRERRLSQREVSDLLGGAANGWSQSRVAKLLAGTRELDVDAMESLCFAVGVSVTEAVRDRGLEFCAEMTPTELRVLERVRALPPAVLQALMTMLDIHPSSIEPRGATKRKEILGKPRLT